MRQIVSEVGGRSNYIRIGLQDEATIKTNSIKSVDISSQCSFVTAGVVIRSCTLSSPTTIHSPWCLSMTDFLHPVHTPIQSQYAVGRLKVHTGGDYFPIGVVFDDRLGC